MTLFSRLSLPAGSKYDYSAAAVQQGYLFRYPAMIQSLEMNDYPFSFVSLITPLGEVTAGIFS